MNDVSKTIGWADKSLNQFTGCLNHVNGLCKGGGFPCYAYKIANRFKERYLSGGEFSTSLECHTRYPGCSLDPFYPRIWPERFKPLKGYPEGTKIFLNDMSDWMGLWIPDEWKRQVIEFITAHPQYIFQTLTKQPQNLAKWSPFPENCWVGVTATDTASYQDACLGLREVEAKVRFISFEPLLGGIYTQILNPMPRYYNPTGIPFAWLIIGQQTPISAKTTPKIEWVQEIVQAADKAGIPVFLKDNLKPLLQQNNHNTYSFPEWAGKQFAITGDYSLAPCDAHPNEPMRQLRQDFPKC